MNLQLEASRRSDREAVQMEHLKFRDVFCAKYGCSAEAFEVQVLWRCLYPGSVWLARWLWRFNPDYFEQDFEAIRNVQHVTSVDELCHEFSVFRYRHPNRGLFRRWLKVRVSGQQLANLARQTLPKAG